MPNQPIIRPGGDASGIQYAPGDPSKWTSQPSNVQSALDDLAASGGGSGGDIVVDLVGAANLTPDASAGTIFNVSVGAVTTIKGPTNGVDGQRLLFRLVQDNAGHTVTFLTGVGNFKFGTTVTGFTASGANAIDYVQAAYRADLGVWDVIDVKKGYVTTAIVLVNSTNGNENNQAFLTVTVPATVTGNTIIAAMAYNNDSSAPAIASVTDNIGNTYVQFPGAYGHGPSNFSCDVWYCVNATGGVTSVTITSAAANFTRMSAQIYEVSGCALSPEDTAVYISNAGSVPSVTATITPAQENEFLIAMFCNFNVVYTGAALPWAKDAAGTGINSLFAHYIGPPIAPVACSGAPATGTSFAATIAAFKPS